jgi:hypothetical protein
MTMLEKHTHFMLPVAERRLIVSECHDRRITAFAHSHASAERRRLLSANAGTKSKKTRLSYAEALARRASSDAGQFQLAWQALVPFFAS